MAGNEKISDAVKAIIQKVLGISDYIKDDSLLEKDLGMDSLDSIEVTMAVEDEFDIEIADEDFDRLKTVQDLLDYVEAHASA